MTSPTGAPGRTEAATTTGAPRPPSRADVVVVGAGIIGAAVADALAGRGLDVVVLERSDEPATGATGDSGGMVRAYDPDPVVADLALRSLATYRDDARWPQGAPLHAVGALTIADPAQEDALRAAAARINDVLGTSAHVVTQRRTAVGVELSGGVALVEPEAGFVDPVAVTRTWLRRAAEAGAEVRYGVRVTGVEDADGHARVLTDAGPVLADEVVVAVGPWGAHALDGLGPPPRVRTRSIQVSIVEGRPPGTDHATVVDLRTGVYARPYGTGASLVGMPHLVWDVDLDAEPDEQHVHATLAALAGHLPWLPDVSVRRTVRSADAYALPDADGPAGASLLAPTAVPHVRTVRGWDGGGVKVAPEAGRRIAETVVAAVAERHRAPAAAPVPTTHRKGDPWLTDMT